LPHGLAGQGCGELKTIPSVVSLGQRLMATGADMGSWTVGRWGRPWGQGRSRGTQAGTRRPVSALTIQYEWLKFSDCTFDEISLCIPI